MRHARGFTLIETALATVIVGVGVLAMVSAQTAFLRQNTWSSQASIAERLGNEIREMTLEMPRHDPVTGMTTWGPEENEPLLADFDDLDDFDGDGSGTVFAATLDNGPIDAQRRVIPNMEGWTQLVEVFSTDPFDVTMEPGDLADGATEMMVVRVIVTYQGPNDATPIEMTRVQWVAPN